MNKLLVWILVWSLTQSAAGQTIGHDDFEYCLAEVNIGGHFELERLTAKKRLTIIDTTSTFVRCKHYEVDGNYLARVKSKPPKSFNEEDVIRGKTLWEDPTLIYIYHIGIEKNKGIKISFWYPYANRELTVLLLRDASGIRDFEILRKGVF